MHLIVGLGEVLWDMFPDGARFGGAPANFACSSADLGGDDVHVAIASAVGSDDLGGRAKAALASHRVDMSAIEERGEPTGQVLVRLDDQGHAEYEFADDCAWDNLHWSEPLARLAKQCDAVCFGTLGQRSAASKTTIHQFLEATRESAFRVLDVNLRSPHWDQATLLRSLELANVLKLNDEELQVLCRCLNLEADESTSLRVIQERYELKYVALTRGNKGSLLLDASGNDYLFDGLPVKVLDTVGAGDAFTAALTLGLLRKQRLETVNAWANRVAAFVCTQAGATPVLPDSLKSSD